MDIGKKIIFMGTPEFAVYSLKQLINNKYNVVAVVTPPDKPAGRGLKLKKSAVKEFAQTTSIPIIQSENLDDEKFINTISRFNADLFIVVAFQILPKSILALPPLGAFNLHASLLPNYRGAAPINHAIINGETQTGVTTFFLDEGIDTGNIIFSESTTINENETASELHDKLMVIGGKLVLKTVDAIFNKNAIVKIQNNKSINCKKAPKIFRNNCHINFNETANNVHNFIRGLSSYPAAWALLLNGNEIKIIKSAKTNIRSNDKEAGSILVNNNKLLVATNDFYIEIIELKPVGKSCMKTIDYLNGLKTEIKGMLLQ